MELFSLLYILFVAVLLFLYYYLPHRIEKIRPYQWIFLLAGSISWYLYMGQAHILFLLLTSFSVWLGGILLERQTFFYQQRKAQLSDRAQRKVLKQKVQHRKRWILLVVLLLNFGILAWLKYWNALSAAITGRTAAGLVLPVGISFYTFQAVGYLIDLYGGKYQAQKNYARFLLFVSWFPQLLEGPINRYDKMSSGLFSEHYFDREAARRSLLLILSGCMKKYAIADMLSPSIGYIFDTGYASQRNGCMIVFGILLYSAQQYADFSGGIDIVMGVSNLFGIAMMPNFRQPYFSVSLGDFWRRWHISLGAWMRDYVFYPFALLKPMQRFGKWCTRHLGKHAGRTLPACIANLLVFVIVGVWHGPELHYLLWGLYNGIVIALSDLTAPFWKRCGKAMHWKEDSRALHVFRILRTFVIVNIGWYFDRIENFSDCMAAFRRTFTAFHAGQFMEDVQTILVSGAGGTFNLAGSYLIAALGLLILFVVSLQKERGQDAAGILLRSTGKRAGYIYLCLLLTFASFVFTQAEGGFLYANF